MNMVILTRKYDDVPLCEKEILRYALCREADSSVSGLLKECLEEALEKKNYKICYVILPVKIRGELCDFGILNLKSEKLAQNLDGCEEAIIFAATAGIGIDRLISKYSRLSPAKALMIQAIGTEMIEKLCDMFCEDIEKEKACQTHPRFSPGYGDLPLETQKDFFAVLDCGKRIGIALNDSLLMSPSKSVTAIAGLGKSKTKTKNKCVDCEKQDCIFRRGVL